MTRSGRGARVSAVLVLKRGQGSVLKTRLQTVLHRISAQGFAYLRAVLVLTRAQGGVCIGLDVSAWLCCPRKFESEFCSIRFFTYREELAFFQKRPDLS